jgi:hypothetical protein
LERGSHWLGAIMNSPWLHTAFSSWKVSAASPSGRTKSNPSLIFLNGQTLLWPVGMSKGKGETMARAPTTDLRLPRPQSHKILIIWAKPSFDSFDTVVRVGPMYIYMTWQVVGIMNALFFSCMKRKKKEKWQVVRDGLRGTAIYSITTHEQ